MECTRLCTLSVYPTMYVITRMIWIVCYLINPLHRQLEQLVVACNMCTWLQMLLIQIIEKSCWVQLSLKKRLFEHHWATLCPCHDTKSFWSSLRRRIRFLSSQRNWRSKAAMTSRKRLSPRRSGEPYDFIRLSKRTMVTGLVTTEVPCSSCPAW